MLNFLVRYSIAILLWQGLSPTAVSAPSTGNIRFQHLTLSQAQAQVYNIVQDQQGYMWFGTLDGLNRFDGYDVKLFTHDPADDTSISNNAIRAMLVDRDGVLWLGTDSGGLSKYNPGDDSFTNYVNTENSASITTNRVRALLEDSKGNFWVGTDGGGLELFDRDAGLFRHPSTTGAQFSSSHIWALLEDQSGNLWVGTDNGLNKFNVQSKSIVRYTNDQADPASISGNHVTSLLQDSQGNLWIGTHNAGLNKYNSSALKAGDGKFQSYMGEPGGNNSLSDNQVNTLFEDDQGTIWIGTFNGLNSLTRKQPGFRRYSHNLTRSHSISHNTVMSIYQDRGGVLWASAYDGVSHWNQPEATIDYYSLVAENSGAFSNAIITTFAENDSGEIWVGTFGSGLHRFDPVSKNSERFVGGKNEETQLRGDQIMSLLVDRGGNLWVGTRSSGLSFLEKGKQDFVQFLHDPDDANSLGANGVTDILEDSKNNIWVGTYTAGLNRLDPSTGKIDRFRNSVHSSMSLSDNRIMALFEDSDEVLWIGTHGGGLNRFTSSSNFQRFQHNSRNPDSISGNNIYAINEDESGNLWIGTQNSGLNRWGLEDRRNTVNNFERIVRNFIDTTVNGLVIDTKGSVWVSSNKGLTQVDINTSRLKRYDTSHGLDAEFNHSAVLAASNGELYFGGMNGFNVFDPSTIGKNTHPPKVVITSVAKFNQQVNNLHTVLTDGLDLNYKDYLIEFRFAGLDYTSPEKTRYKYKLTGLEDTWVEAGDRRYASYTNLAPGNYTFQVIAANNDGAWSHEAATIDIQMTPAPWLTWYAYLAYLGICIFIGWALTGTHREKIRHADHVLEINKMLAIEINAGRAKESALEREKERAQSYLEITDILMVVIDRDGLIKLINQKGCEVLRLTEFQIIGTRLLRYVHQESQDDMQRWLKPGISDDTEAHYECALVSTNGHVHRIMWRFASFPDESGDGELLLASGMDVTDKRELEKAVRVQEKLSAVGTMASGIAHDFNNILTAINGYSVLAIEELSNKQEASKEYLDRVIEAGKRATDLVSRLLSFTHHEEQNLQPSDLGPPLLEAAALLRASLPATIEMSVDISCDLKPVKADTTQIHQLLMNLGTNAGKAMQGHVGVLQIIADTTYLRAPKENLRSAMQAGEYLRLLVQDNGIGMNGDVMCTIFDPFFTAKGLGFGDREGTGLGLSVVHRIVAAHNGHIDVKSQPGKGTTFTVLLPCCREKIDYRDTTGELSQHRFGRIMIVDDEEWVGDVCDKLLQLLGYSSTRFENADQALEELKGNPDKFDLVISDQNMPHMLGTEFVVEIRNINPVIPIILMSGNLSPLYTNDPLINYMKKPFTIEELGGLVKESLLTNVEPQTG